MAMKVIDNFIEDKEVFKSIKDLLFSNTFPYFYNDSTANTFDNKNYFFSHNIIQKGKVESPFFFDMMPIIGRLNFNYIHRIKINCFVNTDKHFVSEPHRDMQEPHKVALFYINTNNGYTLFKNGDRVPSVENRMLLFDGKEKHSSVTQTDTKLRINININYT
jgi:hypothetical protein